MMKTLLAIATIFILILTAGPIPANAQEACVDGVDHATMARGDTLHMCWGVSEDAVVTEYEIYMARTPGQYDYQGDHTIVLATECDEIECKAPLSINVNGEYYFTYLATDGKFLRSEPSNEVRLTVRNPLPPGGGGSGCAITR